MWHIIPPMLVFLVAMTTWLSHRLSSICQSPLHLAADSVSVLYLNLKRDPSRVKSLRLAFPVVGWRSRKKAWLSTAHFHRCLQLLELASWNTNVCSCSRPCAVRKQTLLVGQLVSVCVHVCVFVCLFVCRAVSVTRYTPGHRPRPPPVWVDSF